MDLTGWGRVTVARSRACRPERQQELAAAVVEAAADGIIAFGGGAPTAMPLSIPAAA
jgi:hypothetical protein